MEVSTYRHRICNAWIVVARLVYAMIGANAVLLPSHSRRNCSKKSNQKTVVVIPGDDAAPEAVYPTVELLRNLELEIDFEFPPYGDRATKSHGSSFPEETRHAIDSADATLFGAGSSASSPIV